MGAKAYKYLAKEEIEVGNKKVIKILALIGQTDKDSFAASIIGKKVTTCDIANFKDKQLIIISLTSDIITDIQRRKDNSDEVDYENFIEIINKNLASEKSKESVGPQDRNKVKRFEITDEATKNIIMRLEEQFKLKLYNIESENKKLKVALEREEEMRNLVDMPKLVGDQLKHKLEEVYSEHIYKELFGGIVEEKIQDIKRSFSQNKLMGMIETEKLELPRLVPAVYNDETAAIKKLVKIIEKSGRHTSYNEVANILICMSLGFLTIFAGEPGTGKTSLCNAIANSMGLNRDNERYLKIAVQKGWTTSKDLIGYYNTLTEKFNTSSTGIYKALVNLNYEEKHEDIEFPYIITLDEANLSSLECYWSDFIGICDLDASDRAIGIGNGEQIDITENLRFLATINLDYTTEALTPRLISRAWIITLDNCTNIENSGMKKIEAPETIPYKLMNKLYKIGVDATANDHYKYDAEVIKKLNKIRETCNSYGMQWSPRIVKMIKQYIAVGSQILILGSAYTPLDYAIVQKLLPLLSGNGQKYSEFISELIDICPPDIMTMSNLALKKIKITGEKNLKYYNFLSR